MVKSVLFMGLGCLLISTAAFAAPSAMKMECENLGPSNDLCLFTDDAREVKAVQPVAGAIPVLSTKAIARDELSGAAADLENRFAVETLFEDATEVRMATRSQQLAGDDQAFRALSKLRMIEDYLKTPAVSGISARLTEAGKK